MFAQLSDQRVTYEKTTHSVAIADHLLEKEPDALREMVDLITEAMAAAERARIQNARATGQRE